MRYTRICLDGRIPNLKRLHFHRNASNIIKHFPAKLWVKRLALSSALCRYGLRSLQYTRYHFLAWGLRKLEKCSSEAGPTPHPTQVKLLTHDIYVYSVCSDVIVAMCVELVLQLHQDCMLGEVLAPHVLSSFERSDLIVSTPMEFRNRAVRTAWQKLFEQAISGRSRTWKGSQVLGIVLSCTGIPLIRFRLLFLRTWPMVGEKTFIIRQGEIGGGQVWPCSTCGCPMYSSIGWFLLRCLVEVSTPFTSRH